MPVENSKHKREKGSKCCINLSEVDEENTLLGSLFENGFCQPTISSICSIYIFLMAILICPVAVIITGIWALVQCAMFFTIITQTSITVIILSVLTIITGVLAMANALWIILCMKSEFSSQLYRISLLATPMILLFILDVMLIALGIAASFLIPSLSTKIMTDANNSLLTIGDSQGARNAWDTTQTTLQCCGAAMFSDYEQVFNNFSVPVSCCNTTNPDIACDTDTVDVNLANTTIYIEGCVPQLVSIFRRILSVIAGVTVIVGLSQILGVYPFALFGGCFVGKEWFNENETVGKTYPYYPLIFGLILVCSPVYIIVAIWALVQNIPYYSITAPASINVVVISVLLIIAGVLMIGTGICQIALSMKFLFRRTYNDLLRMIFESIFVIVCFPPILVFALVVSIVAASMSGPTRMELSSTLDNYLLDQTVQETWNNLQQNMECCGVVNFADYEAVFKNFSVPASCCNTTNPLANVCPDIVRNSQNMINQTGLIYSEGCVSHLESFFNHIFSVTAAVSITVAGLQFAAIMIGMWWFIVIVYSDEGDD